MDRVVVVGASLAGLRAAETLRTAGFTGSLTLVGDEPHLPYDRPPLSKQVLSGDWDAERAALRKAEQLEALGITWRLGTRAVGLRPDAQEVVLEGGEALPYDGLVIATGATPRRLPGQPDLPGIHLLRTLDHAQALHAELAEAAAVVVVGAGFIGAEAASTAHALGCQVTVVEAAPVPLERGLGVEMGAAVAGLHADSGVTLLTSAGVAGFEGTERVEGVRLTDGRVIPADVVVVGIGVAPATGWLEGSGLTLRDGVVCDATLAAGPPGVMAAGDVARWPHELFDGEEVRIEHWTNANEHGAVAAKNLLALAAGEPATPYAGVPFFWSDQYGHRIQFLGRSSGADEVRVVRGSAEARRFVALYRRGERLWGALGLDEPKQLMGYRKLLLERASWVDALAHAAAVA